MTILKHELRQGTLSFWIWTGTISFLMVICIFLFPEMKAEMEGINNLFASMGVFSAAFGMDKLNFGTLLGFYSVECGNILGLGGAFFASFCAAGILSKEEKDRTAEFLFAHPVNRARVITEKLAAVLGQIAAMNLIIYGLSVGSVAVIGEEIPWTELNLFHLAYFFMQLELAGICFGISAFIKKGSAGIGLGIASLMYFLNLVANITESAGFLKYITPFAFCEGAEIAADKSIDGTLLVIGLGMGIVGIALAYVKYMKKDIQ